MRCQRVPRPIRTTTPRRRSVTRTATSRTHPPSRESIGEGSRRRTSLPEQGTGDAAERTVQVVDVGEAEAAYRGVESRTVRRPRRRDIGTQVANLERLAALGGLCLLNQRPEMSILTARAPRRASSRVNRPCPHATSRTRKSATEREGLAKPRKPDHRRSPTIRPRRSPRQSHIGCSVMIGLYGWTASAVEVGERMPHPRRGPPRVVPDAAKVAGGGYP